MTRAEDKRRSFGIWVVRRGDKFFLAESYSSDETLAGPFDTYDEAHTRRQSLEPTTALEANDS